MNWNGQAFHAHTALSLPSKNISIPWSKPMFFLSSKHTHTQTQSLHPPPIRPSPPWHYLCSGVLASWVACHWELGRDRGSWCWLLFQSQMESGTPPGAPCLQLVVRCLVGETTPPPDHHLDYLSRASRELIVRMWSGHVLALCLLVYSVPHSRGVCVWYRDTISKCVCLLEEGLYWLSGSQTVR